MGVKVQESAVELIKSRKEALLHPLSGSSSSRTMPAFSASDKDAEEAEGEEEEDKDIHALNEKVSVLFSLAAS
jgi:hypothetical protein